MYVDLTVKQNTIYINKTDKKLAELKESGRWSKLERSGNNDEECWPAN